MSENCFPLQSKLLILSIALVELDLTQLSTKYYYNQLYIFQKRKRFWHIQFLHGMLVCNWWFILFRCSIISSTFSYLLLCLVILPKVMFRIQLYLLEEPHYRNVSNPYTYCWRIVPRWQRWLCSTLFNSLMVSLIDLWLQITLLTDFALHLFVTVISLLLLLDNKNTQTKKQMTAAAAGRLRLRLRPLLLQTSTRLWRWWLVFHLFVPALTNQQTKHCCLAMTFFTFIVFGTLTVHPLGFLLSPCTRWCAHARLPNWESASRFPSTPGGPWPLHSELGVVLSSATIFVHLGLACAPRCTPNTAPGRESPARSFKATPGGARLVFRASQSFHISSVIQSSPLKWLQNQNEEFIQSPVWHYSLASTFSTAGSATVFA